MTILVNIRIAVFSRPQLGNLESVFELFKLTFHSQAPLNQEPWFTQFWEALFKGLEFIWSSFWSLSEQSSLSFLLKLELLPMERKRMGRKVFPVNFPGIPTYPLDMDLPNIPQKSPIPIQWPLTDLPWSPTDFPWTPITSHWLANKARCLKLIESFLSGSFDFPPWLSPWYRESKQIKDMIIWLHGNVFNSRLTRIDKFHWVLYSCAKKGKLKG